jgi:hypothetical protein
MGLGRREFTKLIGLALAGVVTNPLDAIAFNRNYYVNKKFGLILEKPDNWDFISHKDFGKLKEVQLLSEDYEPIKAEVWEDLTDPILVIAKYGLNDEKYKCKFSPAINIWVNHKSEIESDRYNSFKEIAEDSFLGIQQVFKNFEVVQGVTRTELSSCEAYETKSTLLYVNTECNISVTCHMWSFLVDHGDHYYGINMIDSHHVQEIETDAFQKFVRTIKLS